MREVRAQDGRLYLNGRRLELQGASIQEDAAGEGDAMSAREMDAAVNRLKRIGANATRAQHALSPALLERLDAAGILVWQGVGAVRRPRPVGGVDTRGAPSARCGGCGWTCSTRAPIRAS